jgi:hypothetical protein
LIYYPIAYFHVQRQVTRWKHEAPLFAVGCLESEELRKLFSEVSSHVQRVRIEMVPCRGSHRSRKEHPAATIGLTAWSPTILFTDSMNTGERTEAIAHELSHLVLVYRFGLGVIGRRISPPRTLYGS